MFCWCCACAQQILPKIANSQYRYASKLLMNLRDTYASEQEKLDFTLENVFDKNTGFLNFSFTANEKLQPPHNLTDFFKGTRSCPLPSLIFSPGQWSKFGDTSSWRVAPNAEEVVNPFSRHTGILVFQLSTKQSPLSFVDIVQVLYIIQDVLKKLTDQIKGDLMIRDGMWSTDGNKRYLLQGLYFWNTGDLFMIANPSG